MLGFPFCPSSLLASTPINLGGLEFPSIARINAGIAVDGLARDLNHHIPAYRCMARVTLADWTCHLNGCIYPLDRQGLGRTFTRFVGSVPTAWIIAQEHLAKCKISVRITDQSHLLVGECSLSHVLSLVKPHLRWPEPPSGHIIRSVRAMGFRLLKQVGQWGVINGNKTTFVTCPIPPGRWSPAQRKNWQLMREFLACAEIGMLYDGDPDLLLSRDVRRSRSEAYIKSLASIGPLPPTPEALQTNQWGTDGSMIPSSAGILDEKSVTVAVTGSKTVALRLTGRNISILQGELMGLVAGLVISNGEAPEKTIHTDHLNSVRLIEDSGTAVGIEARLRHMNGRSYYRWIQLLLRDEPANVLYTRVTQN